MIARVPGGFQKIVQLDSVNGTFPLLRLSEPGMKNRLLAGVVADDERVSVPAAGRRSCAT